jgi:hypothetical protein
MALASLITFSNSFSYISFGLSPSLSRLLFLSQGSLPVPECDEKKMNRFYFLTFFSASKKSKNKSTLMVNVAH